MKRCSRNSRRMERSREIARVVSIASRLLGQRVSITLRITHVFLPFAAHSRMPVPPATWMSSERCVLTNLHAGYPLNEQITLAFSQ
jgi:hypothetical protein